MKRFIIVLAIVVITLVLVTSATADTGDKWQPVPIQYEQIDIPGAHHADCPATGECVTICFFTDINGDVDIDCEPFVLE